MTRARSLSLALALGAAMAFIVAVPRAAIAQVSPADEAKRKQLFEQAKQLADEGRWAEAAQPLREVIRIRSAPKALIALAVVERELLHLLQARALLLRASEEASLAKLPDDDAAAKKLLAELEPLVPKVELDLVEPSLVLSLFVDDTPALRVASAVWVDPGKRVVRFEAPGRVSQRVTVELAARETTRVRVDLPSASASKPAGPAPVVEPEEGASTPALAGSISLGLGGAGLGVAGAVLMAMGHSSQQEVEDACGGTTNCAPSLQPLGDEGARNIVLGDVLIGVGGAALVGGAIWLAVELSGVAREEGVKATFDRGGVRVLF